MVPGQYRHYADEAAVEFVRIRAVQGQSGSNSRQMDRDRVDLSVLVDSKDWVDVVAHGTERPHAASIKMWGLMPMGPRHTMSLRRANS